MENFWNIIKKPIRVLAPMDDVTDIAFRELIAKIAKPDVMFTEFTSVDALVSQGRDRAMQKLRYTNTQRPIVAQLWGSNPKNFQCAARLVEDLGFNGIDINMGCPEKAIIKKSSGAFLINQRELVDKIISETKKGSPNLPLSIKTRIDVSPEMTHEWFLYLLSKNIDALTIHARKVKIKSKGKADWEEIGKAVELRDNMKVKTLIIGNGDVKNTREIKEKHKIYNVDGVMVGRGIFHNPWLFEKSKNITMHTCREYIDLLLMHTDLFNEIWGKDKYFGVMKKFFKIYIKNFKGANDLRQSLMESTSFDEVYAIIYNFKNTSNLD